MSDITLVRTYPGSSNYSLFEDLPKQIYEENSPRFILGNDPVEVLLEGCYVLMRGNESLGRFAFYENPALRFENEIACTIGSFECVNNPEISQQLLSYAVQIAMEKGYKRIIGPMEGSTWNNYRFSDHNKFPNFFMEPYHHDYYPLMFENFGFKPIANYISILDNELQFEYDKVSKFESIFIEKGARFRKLNMSNLESELYKIAQFNNESFDNNFLFTPIAEEDFVKKYLTYREYFDPDLVWIVEDENEIIQALSFSIKDYMNTKENSLIIKTIARKKDSSFRGIGAYLAHKTYQLAKHNGYTSIIHAMMIQDNASVSISEKYSMAEYKSYSLFSYEI